MKHYQIIVTGRVQGIGYRNFVRSQARYLGIKGFVKNLIDGSVYIEAEANTEAMALFIKSCKTAHPVARIDDLTIQEVPLVNFTGFEARY